MSMLRRCSAHFAWPVLVVCSAVPCLAQERAPLPNVIVIVSDDQGWADIGYQNPKVYSPRLDDLAAAGARFSQAYVMPQCTPTRVALMTGRYPSRFGRHAMQASNEPAFPLGTKTLATMFREQGYATWLVGKWHLGSSKEHGPQQFGFDHSYGLLAGACGNYDHRYRDGRFEATWHRDGDVIPGYENGTHVTDLLAAEAVRVIEAAREQPFFLYLAFTAVHTPLDERGRFVDRPTQRDPERPGRWLDEDEIEWFHDPKGLIQSEPDPEKRLLLAAVHHLDAAVGRVVDALERSGQRDNTMIVFTSDNGPQGSWPGNAYPDDLKLTDFNQPLPMRGKKVDVWEGGIRVPSFVVWRQKIAPKQIDTPVHVIDWFPTLARQVVYRPGPESGVMWDGIDQTGPIFGRSPAFERDLYWTWASPINRWALRHDDWKIVRYGKGEPAGPQDWQLFDLRADPLEAHDVAADHPEIVEIMWQRFRLQRDRDRR